MYFQKSFYKLCYPKSLKETKLHRRKKKEILALLKIIKRQDI